MADEDQIKLNHDEDSDSIDMDIDVEAAEGIELGFVENFDGYEDEWSIFDAGGRTGGQPVWLNPKYIPPPSSLQCENCLDPMMHLLQLYAPINSNQNAFHRSLYLFTCLNERCIAKGGVKLLRCQLKEDNEFYGPRPDFHLLNKETKTNICVICGGSAVAHCGKCKSVYYCSRQHQVLHWKKGGHKLNCNGILEIESEYSLTETSDNSCSLLQLPSLDIVTESEPNFDERERANQEATDKLLETYKVSDRVDDTADDISTKDIAEATQRPQIELDSYYNYFTKRVLAASDQCIRYSLWNNDAILWVNATNQPSDKTPPPCSYCGGVRKFEFQVMPQLLHYLDLESRGLSLDWGTIVVYTCVNSCDASDDFNNNSSNGTSCSDNNNSDKVPTVCYRNEFCYVQPMSSEKE